MAESWVAPEACALPTAEQPLRVAEFDGLFAEHLESVERVAPTETRMELVGREGLAAVVQDLAHRETACCSFFEFRVSAAPAQAGRETVQLEIRVPVARVEAMTALAHRAVSAMAGRYDE